MTIGTESAVSTRVQKLCENGTLDEIRELRKESEVEVVKFYGEKRGRFSWASITDGGRYRYTSTEYSELEIWDNITEDEVNKFTLRKAKVLVGKPGVRVMANITLKKFTTFDWEDAPDIHWAGKLLYILTRWRVYTEIDALLCPPVKDITSIPLRIYLADTLEDVEKRAHEQICADAEDDKVHFYGTVMWIKDAKAADVMTEAEETAKENQRKAPLLLELVLGARSHIIISPHPPPPPVYEEEDKFEMPEEPLKPVEESPPPVFVEEVAQPKRDPRRKGTLGRRGPRQETGVF
jgi:hypothetical protein